jgi:hypothetical protein
MLVGLRHLLAVMQKDEALQPILNIFGHGQKLRPDLISLRQGNHLRYARGKADGARVSRIEDQRDQNGLSGAWGVTARPFQALTAQPAFHRGRQRLIFQGKLRYQPQKQVDLSLKPLQLLDYARVLVGFFRDPMFKG